MSRSIKRGLLTVLVVSVAFFGYSNGSIRQVLQSSTHIQSAHAVAITDPAWVLSSLTASATGVTYTHTFTTATAIPATTGQVSMELRNPPGPPTPMPDFRAATVAAGSSAPLVGKTPNVFFSGPSLVIQIPNGSTAIPAGTVTVILTGVTNPSSAGMIPTNTSTSSSGTTLDGTPFGPDPNGKLKVGTDSIVGTVKDATTATGLAGVSLQVHPGPGSATNGFWQTTTDSSGSYSFAGIPAGSWVIEKNQGVDPNSSNAAALSKYVNPDPQTITVPSSGSVTVTFTLTKASKFITGTVLYDGTTTPVAGAMVNAGFMGGNGFSNSQTDSSGKFTLQIGSTGNFFLQVQPMMMTGGGPGGGTPPPSANATDFATTSMQGSLVKAATVAETLDFGSIYVQKADATVTVTVKKPDGSVAANQPLGMMNFAKHSFSGNQTDSKGVATFKVVHGGSYEFNMMDPTGTYSMPKTRISPKAGASAVSLTLLANDKTITVTAVRIDSGANVGVGNAQAMVFSKDPGPPYFATTGTNGVATVKVPSGFEGRAGAMPGGNFGGGPQGGDKAGGGGKPGAFLQDEIDAFFGVAHAAGVAIQAAPQGGSSDANQLFPLDGFKKVSAGDSVTVRFDKASKAVVVVTKDKNGALVTKGAFIDAKPSGGSVFAHFNGPIAGGTGTVYTVKGNVDINVFYPPDQALTAQSTTVAVGDAGASATVTVVSDTVTVSGSIVDGSNSNAVIKDASGKLGVMVGAFSSGGIFKMGQVNAAAGTYTLKLPPGIAFRLGVATQDSIGGRPTAGGYVPNVSSGSITGTDGQAVSQNLTLTKIDAVITGKVTTSKGDAVEGAVVSASDALASVVGTPGPGGPGGPGEGAPEFGFSDTTQSDGTYTINVASGKTYGVTVNAKGQGLFSNGVVSVKPASGERKSVNLTVVQPDSTLEVKATDSDGKVMANAKVSLVSKDGNITFQGTTDANGVADMNIPGGTDFTFKAGKDIPENYESDVSKTVTVNVPSGQKVATTVTVTADTDALAKPTTQQVSSSSSAVITATKANGDTQVAVNIPAGALSSSSGSSSDSSSSSSGDPVFTVSPLKGEGKLDKTHTPIIGASFVATDSSGNAISSLSSSITGEIDIPKSQIPSGVTAAAMSVSYYDESAGKWTSVNSSVAELQSDGSIKATFSTTHLTDFAVTTTTDTTAPAAPTNIVATAKGNNTINLSWTNPTDSDFASVTIYRSTSAGDVGSAVLTGVSGESKDDTGLTSGTTYYYIVRAVDSSGNESTNTTQVSTKSVSSKLPRTGTAFSNEYVSTDTGLDFFSGLVKALRHAR